MISIEVLDQYEEDVTAFLAGRIPADRFAGLRLLQGIYAQRQDGYCMVRTKIPGGRLDAGQLYGLAAVLDEYSEADHDVVHLTTRQNVQFHYVRIERTPAMLRDLARGGVTTREASGNTVRNITACPLAGVCPREHVDVQPYLEATARHFLGHPLTRQLPRKFKISFSGCDDDCAQGMTHDLALIATRVDGAPGFRVLAFGGLGAKPHEGVELDPFVPVDRLLAAVEAVLGLHHRYSNRKKRSQARIKFLVDRFGIDKLRTLYHEELAKHGDAPAGELPEPAWRTPTDGPACDNGTLRRVVRQHQPGLVSLPVSVPLGRLRATQLRGLARLVRVYGLPGVRVVQDQNLVLHHVAEVALGMLRGELAALGLGEPRAGDNVVSCPGTRYCPLAITGSPYLAEQLDGGNDDLRVRVNGCQNSCGQSDTGDIGFFGTARRRHGRLVPSYTLQLGGNGTAGGGYGVDGPVIPAHRAAAAVERVVAAFAGRAEPRLDFRRWVAAQGGDFFTALCADLVEVDAADVETLLNDLGSQTDFKVTPAGVGECAGVGIDHLELARAEITYQRNSRNAFATQDELAEADRCLETILETVVTAVAAETGQTVEGEGLPEAGRLSGFPGLGDGLVGDYSALVVALKAGSASQERHAELAGKVEAWADQVLVAVGEAAAAGLATPFDLPAGVAGHGRAA